MSNYKPARKKARMPEAPSTESNDASPSASTSTAGVIGAMKSLLGDEELSDVTLRANDGVLIKANRCILATRSPVFRNMLYGNYSEASSSIVTVSQLDGFSLQALVEYIYTDTIDSLKNTVSRIEFTRHIFLLVHIAKYFDIAPLSDYTVAAFVSAIEKDPPLALCILTAEFRDNSTVEEDGLRNVAYGAIRRDPEVVLVEEVVPSLQAAALTTILEDKLVQWTSHLHRFQVIHQWAMGATHDEMVVTEQESQKAVATEMIQKYVELEFVDSQDLAGIVTKSGLVTNDMLLEAYKTQALKASDKEKRQRQQPKHGARDIRQHRPPQFVSPLAAEVFDGHKLSFESSPTSNLTRGDKFEVQRSRLEPVPYFQSRYF